MPATGEVLEVRWPSGEGIRVDSGVARGDVVGTRYDPLLAKLIAHGTDRAAALARLSAMLDDTSVLGLTTNRGFLRWLLKDDDVCRGALWTTLIDEQWRPQEALPDAAWAVGALPR